MANLNTGAPTQIDLGFHALADATRRAVIEKLHEGEAAATELAEPFDMALPSFMKHLRVLEAGGLISTRKEGRKRMCRLERAQLARLSGWINAYEAGWQNRLDRLDAFFKDGE
ncbi:MAG: transcriptional regulator [Ponticaulis sp.]|nr:transcriptional regulator [Ponticaulis sp.]